MTKHGAVVRGSHVCRRWLQRVTWLALACTAGCDTSPAPNNHSDILGRYEPAELPDGGASFATQPCTRQEIMDQNLAEQPPGSLDVSFMETVAPGVVGTHDTEQTGHLSAAAIWIEDANGALVRTLDLWCYAPFCIMCLDPYYSRFLGGCKLDVITRASLHAYEPWMHTWDGKSLHGTVVPDGAYVLTIDVQIDEYHYMDPVKIPFTKGRMPWTMQLPPTPPHSGLKLTYTPG